VRGGVDSHYHHILSHQWCALALLLADVSLGKEEKQQQPVTVASARPKAGWKEWRAVAQGLSNTSGACAQRYHDRP